MTMSADDFNLACARAAHEVNRVYCAALGDNSQVPWESAPEWQRESSIKGVTVTLGGGSPEDSHRSWLAEKARTGWVYGPVKDADKKTHPCMVPYSALPRAQRAKDALYQAAVRAMSDALEEGIPRTHCPCGAALTAKTIASEIPFCEECQEGIDAGDVENLDECRVRGET